MEDQNRQFTWKEILALGAAVATVVLAFKVDGEGAEKVLADAANTFKGMALALEGSC